MSDTSSNRCCENCGNMVCATSLIAFHWDECVDSNFQKHWRPKFDEFYKPSTITMIPPKRTRYDKLMAEMTVEKLAELRTTCADRYNSVGEYEDSYWINASGRYDNYESAIAAEIAYLSEVDDAG